MSHRTTLTLIRFGIIAATILVGVAAIATRSSTGIAIGFPALLGGVLALFYTAARILRRTLTAKRRHDNAPTCHHCDYNLTGITDYQCPECGTVIAKALETPSTQPFPPRSEVGRT